MVQTATRVRRPWKSLTPERIRAARLALGLTQEEFAILVGRTERRGISPPYQHVGRWERGERRPSTLWGKAILEIVEQTEAQIATAGDPARG